MIIKTKADFAARTATATTTTTTTSTTNNSTASTSATTANIAFSDFGYIQPIPNSPSSSEVVNSTIHHANYSVASTNTTNTLDRFPTRNQDFALLASININNI